MSKPNTVEAFWANVEKTDSCWIWRGCKDKDGYGLWTINYKQWRGHRFSFWVTHGKINTKSMICHTCDNPSCVNPDHLYEGNATTNNRDTVNRGRYTNVFKERTHCFNGHLFEGENLYYDSKKRVCKICRRIHDKNRYIRDKEKRNNPR